MAFERLGRWARTGLVALALGVGAIGLEGCGRNSLKNTELSQILALDYTEDYSCLSNKELDQKVEGYVTNLYWKIWKMVETNRKSFVQLKDNNTNDKEKLPEKLVISFDIGSNSYFVVHSSYENKEKGNFSFGYKRNITQFSKEKSRLTRIDVEEQGNLVHLRFSDWYPTLDPILKKNLSPEEYEKWIESNKSHCLNSIDGRLVLVSKYPKEERKEKELMLAYLTRLFKNIEYKDIKIEGIEEGKPSLSLFK